MSVSLYKPRHRATNAIPDGRSRATCTGHGVIRAWRCPVHGAESYADSMARHADDSTYCRECGFYYGPGMGHDVDCPVYA